MIERKSFQRDVHHDQREERGGEHRGGERAHVAPRRRLGCPVGRQGHGASLARRRHACLVGRQGHGASLARRRVQVLEQRPLLWQPRRSACLGRRVCDTRSPQTDFRTLSRHTRRRRYRARVLTRSVPPLSSAGSALSLTPSLVSVCLESLCRLRVETRASRDRERWRTAGRSALRALCFPLPVSSHEGASPE